MLNENVKQKLHQYIEVADIAMVEALYTLLQKEIDAKDASLPYEVKDRYFVLKYDDSVNEYLTLDEAVKSDNRKLIIIDTFKSFFTPYGGYRYRVPEFIFLNDDKNTFKLSKNSWTVREIVITYISSKKMQCFFIISDPFSIIGERISVDWNFSCEYTPIQFQLRRTIFDSYVEVVKLALIDLEKVCNYSSWKQIDNDTFANLCFKNSPISVIPYSRQ